MTKKSKLPNDPKKEQDEFLLSLGAAIQQWQMVEAGLFNIYQALTSPDVISFHNNSDLSRIARAAAYHAVINFKTTVDMIDAAAKIRLHYAPDLLNRWSKFLQECKGQATIRNRLAHNMLVLNFKASGEFHKFTLSPNLYNPLSDQKKAFSKSQIKSLSKSFFKLGLELDKFYREILTGDYVGSPSKYLLQPMDHSSGNQTQEDHSRAKP